MGQVNVNPGGSSDSGFGAGMIIGIILLILIVLVLIFYAGPQIFGGGTPPRCHIYPLSTAFLAYAPTRARRRITSGAARHA
jgi:hypothetical protein